MNYSSIKLLVRLLSTGLLILMFSLSAFTNPKDKKLDQEKQRLEADAAAVAYINCKYNLAKYYSESKPKDLQLQKEFENARLLKLQFSNQVAAKYRTPAEDFERFTKEVEDISPKLKTCIKYQNILDANEKLQQIK